MTQIDRHPARRRFTWSARGHGNRIFYALVAGWLIWLVTDRPPVAVFLGAAVIAYVLQTVFFLLRDAFGNAGQQRRD